MADQARGGPQPERGRADSPGQRAAEAAGEMKGEAKQQASDAARQAKSKAGDAAREARQRAEEKAEQGRRSLTESVTALAMALDAAAGSLEERDQRRLSEWSRDAGERVRRMASYLERNDTSGLVHDLEGTARENPAAFVGTSLAAGLAAGRFLRSSEADSSREGGEHAGGAGGAESRRRYQPPSSRHDARRPGMEPGGYAAGPPQGTGTAQSAGFQSGSARPDTPGGPVRRSPAGPQPDGPVATDEAEETRNEGGRA